MTTGDSSDHNHGHADIDEGTRKVIIVAAIAFAVLIFGVAGGISLAKYVIDPAADAAATATNDGLAAAGDLAEDVQIEVATGGESAARKHLEEVLAWGEETGQWQPIKSLSTASRTEFVDFMTDSMGQPGEELASDPSSKTAFYYEVVFEEGPVNPEVCMYIHAYWDDGIGDWNCSIEPFLDTPLPR